MDWTYVRPWLATGARLVLGVLFLISGWTKLANPTGFLRGVLAYEVTGNWIGKGIAYGLPVLEICVAVLLILGVLVRYAAAAAGVLLVLFTLGLIEVLARGLKIDSAWFGTGGSITGAVNLLPYILLDLVLLVLAGFLFWWPDNRIGLDEFLARGDYVEMPSAKRMRTEQGMRKYRAEVAAKERDARSRTMYLSSSLAILVVLVTLIAVGVQAKRAKITAATTAANGSHVLGVAVGKTARVTIDLFEDFQCPKCLQLEQTLGSDLNSMAASAKIQVRYHPVAIYDRNSTGNRYSSRAANAAVCASDISAKDYQIYHDYLFAKDGNGNLVMPRVGGHGRTDSSLIAYGEQQLHITGTDLSTFQSCVQGDTDLGFVQATTNNFTNRGFNSAPVLLVNNVRLTDLTVAGLNKAIAKALLTAPPLKVTPSSSSAPVSSAAQASSVAPASSGPPAPSAAASASSSSAASSTPPASSAVASSASP